MAQAPPPKNNKIGIESDTPEEVKVSIKVAEQSSSGPIDAQAFRMAIDLLPDPAGIVGTDGIIFKVNAAALALLEADHPDQIIGKIAYGPGGLDPDYTKEEYDAILAGETVRHEMNLRTVKGNRRLVELVDVPLRGPTGEVEYVLAIGHDITELRLAERSQALLASIVASSDDAIISLAPDGRITTWNQGAQRMLGYTADEAIGHHPYEIYALESRRSIARERIEKLFADIKTEPGIVRHLEVPLRRKDGSHLEVSQVASGIYDSTGGVVGLSLIIRDISRRRRAQREQALLAG
ncbi:MAG: PAS domain-containing protein, partial [Candidatus Binataceae bacterium]|nr:PAS domain-containing protein [Candidatus Binataceae bacterium]